MLKEFPAMSVVTQEFSILMTFTWNKINKNSMILESILFTTVINLLNVNGILFTSLPLEYAWKITRKKTPDVFEKFEAVFSFSGEKQSTATFSIYQAIIRKISHRNSVFHF